MSWFGSLAADPPCLTIWLCLVRWDWGKDFEDTLCLGLLRASLRKRWQLAGLCNTEGRSYRSSCLFKYFTICVDFFFLNWISPSSSSELDLFYIFLILFPVPFPFLSTDSPASCNHTPAQVNTCTQVFKASISQVHEGAALRDTPVSFTALCSFADISSAFNESWQTDSVKHRSYWPGPVM